MASDLSALSIGAHDPPRLAEFWAGVLGRSVAGRPDGTIDLPPDDEAGLPVRFRPSAVEKTSQNVMHFDLTSATPQEQQATVERALGLGARHVDVGQLPEEEHVVLADPEGNEFCVIEAGNRFLAGCGRIGALSSDGTRAVGRFWSEALGWPLVWDQDEETAIQSPRGGTKITWGGPPLMPKAGVNPLRLELVPAAGAALSSEVARLLALGATMVDLGGDGSEGAAEVVLADPDGNEFAVCPPNAPV